MSSALAYDYLPEPRLAPRHRVCRTQAATMSEFVMPPHCAVPDHAHRPPHIVVMLGGSMFDVEGDILAQCATGSLRYSPGGDHHRIRISAEGAHCLVVEAGGFPELRMKQRVYVDARQCADLVASIRRWMFAERFASPARIEDCVLALFCRVRAMERGTEPPAWVDDIRQMFEQPVSYAAPLADAARLVGRSPGLVARAFRAHHAVSVHRYYRRRQIDRAWGMLGQSDISLSTIAHSCGFADQSHLTRTFVRETGVAPSRLRLRMRDGLDANWYQASPLRVIGA